MDAPSAYVCAEVSGWFIPNNRNLGPPVSTTSPRSNCSQVAASESVMSRTDLDRSAKPEPKKSVGAALYR